MEPAKAQAKAIDEYIAGQPLAVQGVLQTLRQTIKEVVPEAQERIAYQMPAFSLYGKPLVYFGAWSDHIGFYHASPSIETVLTGVAPYRAGKGTLHFPLDQPLPLALIRELVAYRAQENLQRKHKAKKTNA